MEEEIGKNNFIEDPEAETLKYTTFGAAMNQIQWRFDCCGVENSEDYTNTEKWPMKIVGSCYINVVWPVISWIAWLWSVILWNS